MVLNIYSFSQFSPLPQGCPPEPYILCNPLSISFEEMYSEYMYKLEKNLDYAIFLKKGIHCFSPWRVFNSKIIKVILFKIIACLTESRWFLEEVLFALGTHALHGFVPMYINNICSK